VKTILKALILGLTLAIGGMAVAKDEVKYTPEKHYRLGYIGDKGWLKGARVFENAPKFKAVPILEEVDLTKFLPPNDNQGPLGSCTGFGLAHGVYSCLKKDFGKSPIFSPLFIYYNERLREGTLNEDAGAQIRTGIAVLQELGVPTNCKWPYDVSKFRTKPSIEAYNDALNHLVVRAYKIDNRDGISIKRANSAGYCVVYGMLLGADFEKLNKDNYVYRGRKSVKDLIGGHCMIQYGYTKDGLYWSRNQWGPQFGKKDNFAMPEAVMHSKDVSDCWVIDLVKE
jgi:hypothetical protein